jgi:hypothetical protein
MGVEGLLRAVGAADLDVAVVAGPAHADTPGVAAHLAILDERAADVRLEVDLDLLAAVRTGDEELGQKLKSKKSKVKSYFASRHEISDAAYSS